MKYILPAFRNPQNGISTSNKLNHILHNSPTYLIRMCSLYLHQNLSSLYFRSLLDCLFRLKSVANAYISCKPADWHQTTPCGSCHE